MYNKKYRVEKIEQFGRFNFVYEDMEGCVAYIAYLNVGDRGWFLYEDAGWSNSPHRIHTSIVKEIEYTDNLVIVTTENTRLTFRLIEEK